MTDDPTNDPDGAGLVAVDRFMRRDLEACALRFALEAGLIDRLAAGVGTPADAGLSAKGSELLFALLRAGGVVGEGLALTPSFRAILPLRDLLSAKLAFCAAVADDLRASFPAFVTDLPAFMARSRTFGLFRYDRALVATPENLAATRDWVGYTTALTRYEAAPCLERVDLAGHRRMLDLGGNSGEFAARACRRAPDLRATVVDLPVVCALGREHLAGRPEGARVRFVPCDMRRDRLPNGHDLATFKSVLHDWPDAEARSLLAAAVAALVPGGRLVIFERAPMPLDGPLDYAATGNLVFLHFFRDAALYVETMAAHGLTDIAVETVKLDMPFHLISGRKR
ncbi:methyltransferase domain-containing protein [Methylobacterium sp. J-059]|uniref:methyltransferase n=1 Tax=Methylobacterium sp. J-059 TaxID=2836643 RepID=UPI001FB9A2EC|nr:methyltransferase [Methylobacterium sp. J-059]MCJ2038380.1 methyltransferase domain-containing protein [Methylobacterium sp. J-059]